MNELEWNGQAAGQEVISTSTRDQTRAIRSMRPRLGWRASTTADTDLILETDDVKVITGRDLELLLVCNIAVMGDGYVLNSFAYQATVFLQADNGTIGGTIRWNPHFLISPGPSRISSKSMLEAMQAQPGPNGFMTMVSKIERVGATVGSVVRQGAMMGIDYVIHDLPLGAAITVGCNSQTRRVCDRQFGYPFRFRPSSPPRWRRLEPPLTEKPVDFEARHFFGPR